MSNCDRNYDFPAQLDLLLRECAELLEQLAKTNDYEWPVAGPKLADQAEPLWRKLRNVIDIN